MLPWFSLFCSRGFYCSHTNNYLKTTSVYSHDWEKMYLTERSKLLPIQLYIANYKRWKHNCSPNLLFLLPGCSPASFVCSPDTLLCSRLLPWLAPLLPSAPLTCSPAPVCSPDFSRRFFLLPLLRGAVVYHTNIGFWSKIKSREGLSIHLSKYFLVRE